VAPVAEIPMDLEKDITVVDFDMPGHEEIEALLSKIHRTWPAIQKFRSIWTPNRASSYLAALGLTLNEARTFSPRRW